MDLPIYVELKTKNFSPESLYQVFERHRVGHVPAFLDIRGMSYREAKKAGGNILVALQRVGVPATFPYPLYLITEHIISPADVPTVQAPSELPTFFRCDNIKLTARENARLQKITLTKERIYNINLHQRQDDIQEFAKRHRQLYELCCCDDFYENLLRHIE